MKNFILIVLATVSLSCKPQQPKFSGVYKSVCITNDKPSIIVYFKPDGTFNYEFAYLGKNIFGTWEKDGNELTLNSDFFRRDFLLKEFGKDESLWPRTKFSKAKELDKFMVKGKKLYRLGVKGYEKDCYLIKM